MEFYKNMCDGELFAYYNAAKQSVGVLKNITSEIQKIESELSSRGLDKNNINNLELLKYYTNLLCTQVKR